MHMALQPYINTTSIILYSSMQAFYKVLVPTVKIVRTLNQISRSYFKYKMDISTSIP
jgi:hypothetical protein